MCASGRCGRLYRETGWQRLHRVRQRLAEKRTALCLAALCAAPLQAADPGYPHNIDPARLRAEVSALTREDPNHAIEPVNVLFVGSSTVKGWQPSLGRDMHPLAALARGFGGATLPDVLYYSPQLVLKYRPGNVMVYAGDNDIAAYGASPVQVRGAFEQLLRGIRMELPDCRVFFISIKPSPKRWAKWPAMREANALVAARAHRSEHVRFIDVATPMLGPDGRVRPDFFQKDGLHLNPRGYRLWAEVVREALVAAQQRQ